MKENIHKEPSEFAGRTVKIKAGVTHPQVPDFAGSQYRVEDWWDRGGQGTWMDCAGNPACIIYAMRAGFAHLPTDDEVLYGKIGALGHLVHITEIELEK